MHGFAAGLFAGFAVVSVLASPQDEKKPKGNANAVVVEGCVNGSTLNAHHDDLGRGALAAPHDHYKLRGNKDLMKVLTKDLNGHLVEVSGVLDDPAGKQGGGKTMPVGNKTTIMVKERPVSDHPDPASDPVISVESFKDIAPHCSGK